MKTPTTKAEVLAQWRIVGIAFAGLVILALSLYGPAVFAAPVIQPDTLATGIQPELHAQKLAPVATSRGEPVFILVTDHTDHPVTIGSVQKLYDSHDAFILMMDKCTGQTLYNDQIACEIRYAYTAPATQERSQTAVVMIRDQEGNEVGGTILMGRSAQQAGGAQ
jgi:hypothetical protein